MSKPARDPVEARAFDRVDPDQQALRSPATVPCLARRSTSSDAVPRLGHPRQTCEMAVSACTSSVFLYSSAAGLTRFILSRALLRSNGCIASSHLGVQDTLVEGRFVCVQHTTVQEVGPCQINPTTKTP